MFAKVQPKLMLQIIIYELNHSSCRLCDNLNIFEDLVTLHTLNYNINNQNTKQYNTIAFTIRLHIYCRLHL